MQAVPIILVGGFLGAGKTTLLGCLARQLVSEGKRVGLLTNDQAENLVDTQVLRQYGLAVKEVSGGCFCCRFRDLLSASRGLIEEQHPDLLLGEPVGSCTDLSATVLEPLRRFFPDRFEVAPLSVLVDPGRLGELLDGDGQAVRPLLAEKVRYLYHKQLEEAELILLNKSDTLPAGRAEALSAELARRYPQATVLAVSALSGAGLDRWRELLFRPRGAASGVRVLELDYEAYAQGEAALGWLNASLRLNAAQPLLWKVPALELLRGLQERFRASGAEVAHVKLALNATGSALVGNLTSTQGRPFLIVSGVQEAAASEAFLLLNARVQCESGSLESAVRGALGDWPSGRFEWAIQELRCFAPAPPRPTYRIGQEQAHPAAGCGGPPAATPDCPVDGRQVCGVVRAIFKPKPKRGGAG